MTDIVWERIIAIFGMSLWLAFPIGIFIAVIKQDRMAHRTSLYPHLAGSPLNYYTLHAAAEDEDNEPYHDHNKEWEEEAMEGEGGHKPNQTNEEENGLYHYLKGREKLHEGNNINKPGE